MRSKLLLLVLSICVSTLLAEALARLILPVRKVGPGFTLYDPVFGKVHRRSFRGTQSSPEFTMTFSTNSLGFRGPEIMTPLPVGVPMVLFVGDSFTMGDGVKDGEEFPRVIADRLDAEMGRQAVQVINAGIVDTGVGRALRFVKWYRGEWKNPTVLVHQFCVNDFQDDQREGFYRLGEDGGLVERDTPAPKSLAWRLQPLVHSIPGLSQSHLVAAAREALVGWNRPREPERTDARQERLTLELVEELLRVASDSGWPVIGLLVDVPEHQERTLRAIYDRFGATALTVPGRRARPDLFYRLDIHWNRDGHAHVADLLLPVIRRRLAALPSAGPEVAAGLR
jgi:lysophospholipase L1-like esterase